MCFQFGAKVGKVLEMRGEGLFDGAAGGAGFYGAYED
jgi:hypothetical protein